MVFVSENFNPVTDTVPDSLKVFTDSEGMYSINVSDTGTYNVQATHPNNQSTVMISGVKISAGSGTDVDKLDGLLQEPASATIHISELPIEPGGTIYITGTEIKTLVTSQIWIVDL